MNGFFSLAYQEEPFRLFSASHLTALAIVLFIGVLIVFLRKPLRREGLNGLVRGMLVIILVGQEILLQVLRLYNDVWSVQGSLPLHLCGLSALLGAVMLVTRHRGIYEITFFWGMVGATQALLTPDLAFYSYPHIIFLIFFLSHGAILWACLFMTFVEGYRLTYRSVWKAFLATNLLAAGVGLINYWIDANYMFLAHKPEGASILDLLGSWPWYILSLEGIALVLYHLYYLPFAWARVQAGRMTIDLAARERSIFNRLPF